LIRLVLMPASDLAEAAHGKLLARCRFI